MTFCRRCELAACLAVVDLMISWSLCVQLHPRCRQHPPSLNHAHLSSWVLPVHAGQTLPAYLCLQTAPNSTAKLGRLQLTNCSNHCRNYVNKFNVTWPLRLFRLNEWNSRDYTRRMFSQLVVSLNNARSSPWVLPAHPGKLAVLAFNQTVKYLRRTKLELHQCVICVNWTITGYNVLICQFMSTEVTERVTFAGLCTRQKQWRCFVGIHVRM